MEAVMLYILVYMVYVFLPLVPVVMVYKWFPSSQAAAGGEVSMVKFKFGGAAAMYIATLFIGAYVVDRSNFDELIRRTVEPTWEVFVPLEFKSDVDRSAAKQSSKDSIVVTDPTRDRLTDRGFYLKVSLKKPDDWPNSIRIEFPGFEPMSVDLGEIMRDPKNYLRSERERLIELQTKLSVRQRPEFRGDYQENSKELTPLIVSNTGPAN